MAGVVHVPFYATIFRGDRLEKAVAEIAPVALRYGAMWYSVQRNRDDMYRILYQVAFEHKRDWDRFWQSEEFIHFRVANSSYYQVPLLYSWNDVTIEGSVERRPEGTLVDEDDFDIEERPEAQEEGRSEDETARADIL